MESAVIFIVFPILVGVLLAIIGSEAVRRPLVTVASVAMGGVAIWIALGGRGDIGLPPGVDPHSVSKTFSILESLIGLVILWVGIRARNLWIILFTLAQVGLMGWFEWMGPGAHPEAAGQGEAHSALTLSALTLDHFSVVMVLINGVVGGMICLFAIGYMREHHEVHHKEAPDRRPFFFAALFVFLGAMSGLVLADDLLWLFFFWEITTICSFFLIGYPGTDEAKRNSRLALGMNLAGGLAFAIGIVWFHHLTGETSLRAMLGNPGVALGPAALICFAGITKAAQFPFAGWLLGAMVAPTPVSALLHSSAMVKAGVYAVVRMAPIIGGTTVGGVVALVGATTFLVASFAAICTSNAKRVLAYSTVANLGLIVLCGGVGTYEAMWAALLLIVFHAVAKCLLFLCVGVAEHGLHSRDIEEMSALVLRMPRLAVMMQIGMAGMFLAPFGMLISKYAVLKAVLDAEPMLSLFIAFGSAATLFFWVKWMGKLLEVPGPTERIRPHVTLGEWIALGTLTVATFCTCLLFPKISSVLIEPHVMAVYGQTARLDQNNILIMIIMLGLVALFPVTFWFRAKGVRMVDPYLAGANLQGTTEFHGSAGAVHEMGFRNYYFTDFIGEDRMYKIGMLTGGILVGAIVCVAFL